ncbi:hypothetical protein V6V47_21130 [Micromonospora sp. CPCC 205539]|uniref:hypothetical protein n=1 Tax=Micromonospora sp. CPCC 205539 TaxID=3122408 RepID=UPI002FEED409
MNPVLIQPLSTSGYQFTFTGGGADIWVSCISLTTPVALTAPDNASGRATANSSNANRPNSESDRPVTVKEKE